MQGGRKPTKAERKEEARRKRLEELKKRQRKARMKKVWGGVLALVAIVGIALIVVASQSSNREQRAELNTLAKAAGCADVKTPSDQGRQHIQPPQTVNYNSTPPTSGNHYPSWANTGVHTQPIPNENQVHNLEHGHVVIQYKPDLDPNLITQLEAVAKKDPRRVIFAPYPSMDTKVALTAWGNIVGCEQPNNQVVKLAEEFVDRFKGRGPEGDIPGTPNA